MEGWHRLQHWIDLLPRDIVDTDADLLALEAWVGEGLFRLEQIEYALTRAHKVLEEARAAARSCREHLDQRL